MIWLLIGWVLISMIFAEIAPILLTGIGYLLWFIVLVIWTALKTVLRLPVLIIVLPFRLLADGLLFARLLLSEMRRSEADDRHDDEEHHQQDQPDDHHAGDDDDQEFAMRLLGLEVGFSEKELSKAYRKAIAAAHPDTPGGSEEAAKQINAARDVLKKARRRM
ncbi:J domain-containing protein [Limimaricola sp. G21655-S1]|uniref:J domain-containing protein n=1 Tax=Limimaricola sp. G21655-S1 TaxID=3014768 RepID=UPI0022AF819E|nr:J domain-containing protein [Limimaricola sp. G21655-S1]MCZ4262317.1 J domain-containing protein [Limimaricola sp. G21655-S1]